MIALIINWSTRNRFLVILLTLMLTGWGIYAVKNTPLDAIPDLSDVQVIIKTTYPGQAPQVIHDFPAFFVRQYQCHVQRQQRNGCQKG